MSEDNSKIKSQIRDYVKSIYGRSYVCQRNKEIDLEFDVAQELMKQVMEELRNLQKKETHLQAMTNLYKIKDVLRKEQVGKWVYANLKEEKK